MSGETDALAILGGRPVRARPWPKWPRADDHTEQALREVLNSCRWTVSGPYDGKRCFERRFADSFASYNDAKFCTPTTSGTGALNLALLALGIGPADEVLVPGLTWVACASSVVAVGATPILVDVELGTLAMSVEAAYSAISQRTRAIMLVHPFCTIADLDAFMSLSSATGIPVVEDCSQSHGATWRNKRVGTFGAAGCFSMQQSKVLTSGEGGAVITDDANIYDRLEQLRADGRRFGTSPRVGHLELVEVGSVLGRNLSLSEFHAAVLLDRLQHLPSENAHRAARAELLEALVADVEGVDVLQRSPNVTSATYYNFLLRVDLSKFAGNSIDVIGRALGEELSTLVHPVYQPLNAHPLYAPLHSPRGGRSDTEWGVLDPARFCLPVARQARQTCMTLTHPVLLDDDEGMHEIVNALAKVQRHARDLLQLPQGPSEEAF